MKTLREELRPMISARFLLAAPPPANVDLTGIVVTRLREGRAANSSKPRNSGHCGGAQPTSALCKSRKELRAYAAQGLRRA